MITEIIKIELKFPGDGSYTNVTSLVRHKSILVNRRLMNRARRSVVDTMSFALNYDSTVSGKLYAATSRILCKATRDNGAGAALFAGWIPPTHSQRVSQFTESIALEALDNSYLLDLPLQASFQYPAAIGNAPFKILDKTDTANSIVHQVLSTQGYTIPDIVDAACANIPDTVLHVAGEKDEERGRDFLDDLLYEHGYVLEFTTEGKFTVYQWDRDVVTSSQTISSVALRPGLSIEKLDFEEDGVQIEWTETDTLIGTRLYLERVPLSTTTGEVGFTGIPIDDQDYFPPDSDIIDIFQNFKSKWLDTPYLARKSRLENRDLSLITTSGWVTAFTAETGIAIDAESYEAKRAKVRFQNTGGATKKLYTFEITGTALFRSARRFVRCPDTAVQPKKETTRFVFDETRATRLARATSRLLRFADFRYSFPLSDELDPGTILTLQQTAPALDTTIVVLETRWAPHDPLTTYICEGITEFSADTVAEFGGVDVSPVTETELNDAYNDVSPSFADLDDGYDAPSGGTTTPTAPTVVASSAGLRAIKLHWDRQANLTNLNYYEVQVSDNAGANWYALDFTGAGKGAADPAVTTWAAEILYHPNLPLSGTADNPSAKTYHYRVRRRTKQSDVSAWSSTVNADASPVDTGDLTVNALSANLLEAVFANIGYALTIGYAGTGSVSSPDEGDRRIYLDDDEIRLEEYTEGGWTTVKGIKIGGALAGIFLSAVSCQWFLHPEVVLANGANELFPGPGELFTLDNTYENQDGEDTWTAKTNVGFVVTPKKFGTHALQPATGAGFAYLTGQDNLTAGSPHAQSGWYYSGTFGNPSATNDTMRFEFGYDSGSGFFVNIATLTIDNDDGQVSFGWFDGWTVDPPSVENLMIMEEDTWYHLAMVWDFATDTMHCIINGTVYSVACGPWDPDGVQGDSPKDNYELNFAWRLDRVHDDIALDDLSVTKNYLIDPDVYVQHYNHNVAWNGEFNAKDLIIKPAAGGVVQIIDGLAVAGDLTIGAAGSPFYSPVAAEPSAGTFHYMPDVERNNAWDVSFNPTTSWAEQDLSALVPAGTKAIYGYLETGGTDVNSILLIRDGNSASNRYAEHRMSRQNGTASQGRMITIKATNGIFDIREYAVTHELSLVVFLLHGYWI